MRSILTVTGLVVALVAGGAAAQDAVYKVDKSVVAPVVIKEVKPKYTEGAIRRKVQGEVELSVVVQKDGTVRDDVAVTKSLDEELDQQAIEAVKQWLFRPGTKDGEPVNVRVQIEMTFTLRSRSGL